MEATPIDEEDRLRRRAPGAAEPERLSDADASRTREHAAGRPTAEGLTAVASGGAVLTRSGVTDLQRLAGNQATRSLIDPEKILQRQPDEAEGVQSANEPAPAAPDFEGSVKGNLHENPSLHHTLNNFGDQQLEYVLRIHNRGYAMLSLETQYEYKSGGLQEAWIATSAQRGETREVTNGLPPHSSLSLRLFGEKDFTQPTQTWVEGTLEVRRKK